MKGKKGKQGHPSQEKKGGIKPAMTMQAPAAVSKEVDGPVSAPRLDKLARGGKPKKWIQGMHLKKGAMTAAAAREGVSNSEYEQEHKNDSGTSGKRARLALAFKKMKHKT